MIFDLSPSFPVIAAAANAQSVFDTVINSVIDNGPVIAGRFVAGCYMVLTVCIGIRLAKALMEAIYDDSIVTGIADAVQVVVIGLILLMGLTHIPDIAGVIWALVDETMAIMDLSGASGGAKGIASNLMSTTWSIIPEIFDAFFAAPPEPEADKGYFEKAVDTLATALNFTSFMHISLGLVCVLMALIYAIIISVQVAVGLMQITIGIVFLPVTLAFYPIIETWAKNAIGTIAAGIAHMGICAFLISMVSDTAATLTNQVVNGGFTAFGTAIPYEAANKAIAFLALGAFLLVLGLSTGKAVGFATGIFGSVGGMIGRTAARGGAGGSNAGAGKAASSAGKAAGNAAMDAGAKVGAAGAAKGGAAVAGAATGAVTAGVGTAATAAVAAGSQAMQAGGKAAMGAATGTGSAAGAAGLDAAGGKAVGPGSAGTGAGPSGSGGPKASAGEKAGMAAALLGAAAQSAAGKVGSAGVSAARKAVASPAAMAVRKAGAAVGGGAVRMAKTAPKALMKAQLRSTING